MGLRSSCFIAIAVLAVTSTANADTYVVAPDGSGDYPTIQAAIDAATDGDVIELLDGVFTGDGNRDIDFYGLALTVRSQSGQPESCVIDCQASASDPHRGFLFSSGETRSSVLEGVTVRNGLVHNQPNWHGGGILCWASSPFIRDCIIEDNFAQWSGGGIAVQMDGASPLLERCIIRGNVGQEHGGGVIVADLGYTEILDCEFYDNYSAGLGGGLYIHGETWPTIDRCLFQGNSSNDSGGGIYSRRGPVLTISECVFVDNIAPSGGGIYLYISGATTLLNCTFYGNIASPYRGSSVRCYDTALAIIENCILANSPGGEAVYGAAIMACSNVYGNVSGPGSVGGLIGSNGNISEDPLFCAEIAGDFTLYDTSPCAPGYNPDCGLIGALPVACWEEPLSLPYAENFDDGIADGFVVVVGEWEVVEGNYRCLNEEPGVKYVSVVGNPNWTDYRFEVDFATYGSDIQEVMVRYQPAGNWYLITFASDPSNGIYLHKQVGDEQTQLLHIDDFPNENEVWHTLAVRVIQDQIIAYFDGAFVFTYTDKSDPLLAGGIGLVSTAWYDVGWQYAHFDNVSVEAIDPVTEIDDELVVPRSNWLKQNAPNPFNPQTTIRYDLPQEASVTLTIYDVAGREVRRLVGGVVQPGGRHEATWSGTDDAGRSVAAGVYFYRLEAGGYTETRRMTLVK